jgi:EAL and modified HD-GYP domain-containing signal transduction protein
MDLFVARQPIFDLGGSVAGYELLYRRTADSSTASDPVPLSRSGRLMVDAVLGIGLGTLSRGLPAFINVDEETLLDGGALELLDPAQVVLEILETTSATPAVIARCRELVDLGYRLALDDFEYRPDLDPLLELASFVKVDLRATEGEELRRLVGALRPRGMELLAEKVETAEEHDLCVELGFSLFQGFHYLPPELFRERDLPVKALRLVHLLNLLRDIEVPDRQIIEVVRADPGLSYKLLRIVNSAALGGRGVESIDHALKIVGRNQLHQWLVLLLLSTRSDSGQLRELAFSALVRGRFCELAEARVRNRMGRSLADQGAAFLAGVFSRMDRLLGIPMTEVLERVDLTAEVQGALLDRSGSLGVLLGGVEAYEEGRWHDASANLRSIGVPMEMLTDCYLDAVGWTEGTMALGSQRPEAKARAS